MKAIGQSHLKNHLEGKKISFKQAILAKCYECTNGYADGKEDCKVPSCPLYQYMPFRIAGNPLEHTKNGG